MTKRRTSYGRIAFIIVFLAVILIQTANTNAVHAAEKNSSTKHGFYYELLNKGAKRAYDAIVEACENRTGKVELEPVKRYKFWNAYAAVRFDHPEYYWLHNYDIQAYKNQNNKIVSADINIPFNAGSNLAVLEAFAENTARQISSGYSEYEKYKYIFDTVTLKATYGKASGVDDQSITGVILDGMAVCSGYADAFKFLCDKAGLFCIRVEGYSRESDGSMAPGTHAWNMIRVDGSYYWVDVTWADTRAENTTRLYGRTTDYYDFLCATDDMFLKDHIPSDNLLDMCTGPFKVTYPACNDCRYNQFCLMGHRFATAEDSFGCIRASMAAHIPFVEMQFNSTDEMYRAIDILHNNAVIWDFVHEAGIEYSQYLYYYNTVYNTLVFEFT